MIRYVNLQVISSGTSLAISSQVSLGRGSHASITSQRFSGALGECKW